MKEGSRLVEIDAARGVAILMMVVYHTVFDLDFLGIAPVDALGAPWRVFAYATASLFLLIVGISLVVSRARAGRDAGGLVPAGKFLRRGAGIFALGLLVTFATWLYLPQNYVVFGILHLIGVSVMLSPLFFRFERWNIVLGAGVVLAGWAIAGTTGPAFLLPLGIMPPGFASFDYTPLFPWLGVVLVGLGLGSVLYAGGVRQFRIPPVPDRVVAPFTFLGRHSLVIYLIHQPVIILLLGLATETPVL